MGKGKVKVFWVYVEFKLLKSLRKSLEKLNSVANQLIGCYFRGSKVV